MYKILIVDDVFDENLITLRTVLSKKFDLTIETTFKGGAERLKQDLFDIVFLDINFQAENKNGIELLKWIKENRDLCDVVMISGLAGIDDAVKSVKYGAYDFLEKPFSIDRLNIVIDNIIERKKLINKLETQAESIIVTQNSKMLGLVEEAKRYAKSSANVLITGESGTGKDLFAQLIHNKSQRKNNEFVKVNCSAIPENLFESEFFGYKKGAFTGALNDKIGKFELADNGTIFLDEIGELPLAQQSKLLRVIEDGEITKIGDNKTTSVDIHLITATNRNLKEMIAKGEFREDLYYRLNIISINIPPLRERDGDIELLLNYFIKDIALKEGFVEKKFAQDALNILSSYEYPGNVREMKNMVQKLFLMTENDNITKDDIEKIIEKERVTETSDQSSFDFSNLLETMPLNKAKKMLEKKYIEMQLEKYNYNVSATAKALDVIPNNLFRKIKSLDIKVK